MKKEKLFLLIQSILCVVLTVALAVAVIGIYRDGLAGKSENPLEWIFSREKVVDRLRPLAPLIFASLGMTGLGLLLGIKDKNAMKPEKAVKVQNRSFNGSTLRLVLLFLGVCMLTAGIFNGSGRDVFGKAVKICTECVGLG